MRAYTLCLLAATLCASGCLSDLAGGYQCDAQHLCSAPSSCVGDRCARGDSSCTSGLRYDGTAGSLAGACVDSTTMPNDMASASVDMVGHVQLDLRMPSSPDLRTDPCLAKDDGSPCGATACGSQAACLAGVCTGDCIVGSICVNHQCVQSATACCQCGCDGNSGVCKTGC